MARRVSRKRGWTTAGIGLVAACGATGLVWLPLDQITFALWLPVVAGGFIAFLGWIDRTIALAFVRDLDRRRQVLPWLAEVICMAAIVVAAVVASRSLAAADRAAIRYARALQAEVRKAGRVPKTLDGWQRTDWGGNTCETRMGAPAVQRVLYRPTRDGSLFLITVRHGSDDGLVLEGGPKRTRVTGRWIEAGVSDERADLDAILAQHQ